MTEHNLMLLIMVPFFTLVLPMSFIFGVPFARRMHKRRDAKEPGLDQSTLAEMDQVRQRLAELEERVDFTERLLAQQREQEQLPDGGHR